MPPASYTFQQVQEHTDQIWKFQRHDLIEEYQGRPPAPPPFILLSHLHLFIKRVVLKIPARRRKQLSKAACAVPGGALRWLGVRSGGRWVSVAAPSRTLLAQQACRPSDGRGAGSSPSGPLPARASRVPCTRRSGPSVRPPAPAESKLEKNEEAALLSWEIYLKESYLQNQQYQQKQRPEQKIQDIGNKYRRPGQPRGARKTPTAPSRTRDTAHLGERPGHCSWGGKLVSSS